ncbi:MAG TPA: outer membrane protein [Pseudolabrys sp.]|jgi:opacity protein-like surface antigen|nr:outer membrane protein [Pseudolabrys sp.]
MSRVWIAAIAGALCVQAAAALAADMPRTLPPAYEPPAEPVFDLSSGWYVRGDLGYNWGAIQGAKSANGFFDPTDNKLDGGFLAGLGAGIKTQWLRTDVTVDYSVPMKYEGTILSPKDTTAKISALSTLFNGYLDLGTWYHVTPYIGAGAGAAYLSTSDFSSPAAPPFGGASTHHQWNFAWAAMAGVGYQVAPNLMLDVGYRYIDFGDVRTEADSFGAMTFKNVAAHEVRIGLRWSYDDLPVAR